MTTPLEDVLLDARGMRELGYNMPTDQEIRDREAKINELYDGGMKIYDITNYIQAVTSLTSHRKKKGNSTGA